MQTAGMAIFAVHVSLSSKGYTNHARVSVLDRNGPVAQVVRAHA
jgi:hypothetical protein